MKLTWSELKIPPLNLRNFPCWKVQQPLVQSMKSIELSEEELEAFKVMVINEDLEGYLSYSESGKLMEDTYSSLFAKLGITLGGEENVTDRG
jgi:hypothetical protein